MSILNNDNGLLVKELKEFLEHCDPEGEVWIETGRNLTSVVTTVVDLNSIDISLKSNTFEKENNK